METAANSLIMSKTEQRPSRVDGQLFEHFSDQQGIQIAKIDKPASKKVKKTSKPEPKAREIN